MSMKPLRVPAGLPLAFNLLLLLAAPLLLALRCYGIRLGSWSVFYSLGFSLFTLGIFLIPARSWRGFFFWNLPLLVLAPIFTWFLYTFGEPPDENALVTVLTTTSEETLGFIELFHLWPQIIALLVALLLYVLAALSLGTRPLPERLRRGYQWAAVPALLVLLLMPVREDTGLEIDTNETVHLYISSTYPFGGTVSLVGTTLGSMRAMGYFSHKIPYHAALLHPDDVPETDILVIGESARQNEFHINGYSRQTTPQLEGISNLLSYQRAYSTSNLTLYAVPMLVTGTAPTRYSADNIHGNIVDVANEAGFFTAWLSNQEVFLATIFQPKPALWREPSDVTGRGAIRSRPDGVLMPSFHEVVRRPEPRKFIVLHTYGSHWKYYQRLPDDGFKFSGGSLKVAVDHLDHDPDGSGAQNLYDDTVLYTDQILAEIIKTAATLPGRVTVTYVSDHGEDLVIRDGVGGHGFATFYLPEAHIPLMFWANARYIQDRPAIWQALQQRRDTPVAQDAVFYTLASIMGVGFPGLDAQRDITSPQFRPADLANLPLLVGVDGKLAHLSDAKDWHGVPH